MKIKKNIVTWVIYRTDTMITPDSPAGNAVVDIYFLMDKDSQYILAMDTAVDTISLPQVNEMFAKALSQSPPPRRLMVAYGDPITEHLQVVCSKYNIELVQVMANEIAMLCTELIEGFAEHFYSPSASMQAMLHNGNPVDFDDYEDTPEAAAAAIPDAYAPCPCNSGKKYKFCCKKIFREVVEAMCAAEDGDLEAALEWMSKAEKIVGITAEVLCRKAIVYSYFNDPLADEYLNRCLQDFPNYPRAYYIEGIIYTKENNDKAAVNAYRKAIELYPASAPYHLNESYNNLGSALHRLGKTDLAKEAWQQALFHIPSDKYAKNNLLHFFGPEAVIRMEI